MGYGYYDRAGAPITMDEWCSLYTSENKRVALTELIDGVTVSTVWLGLDHSWDDNGPPAIFETMVFNGPHDGDCDRYSTIEEARAGHENKVRELCAEQAK